MRIILSVAAALAFASPAIAAPDFALRGQWDISLSTDPTYVGVVLIDSQSRVTVDSPKDYGRPAKFMGYVRAMTPSRLEMVLTDRNTVVTINCLMQSNDLLHCNTTLANGQRNPVFTLSRVGPGPTSLIPGK